MRSTLLVAIFALGACGPSVSGKDNGPDSGVNPNNPDASVSECSGSGKQCSGATLQQCQNGSWVDLQTCGGQTGVCSTTLGCVACDPTIPTTCMGNDIVVCNSDGSIGSSVQTCATGCNGGYCQDACGMAALSKSYIACDYWPVDLDNAIEVLDVTGGQNCSGTGFTPVDQTLPVCTDFLGDLSGLCGYGGDCSEQDPFGVGASCTTESVCTLDAQHSPYAIVVSNPDTTNAVTVTLTDGTGKSGMVTVNPGTVQSIFPKDLGLADQSLDQSGLTKQAYHLTSSAPIVAYQFNPLDNVGVFSNDASLLIPASTYDTTYYVVDSPTLTRTPYTHDFNAYVTVVASSPGTTTVTVDAAGTVRAGNGVGAISAGQSKSFTLTQFQTLNLEAAGGGAGGLTGSDLTGTKISSDRPIGVFVGHEATELDPPGTAAGSGCCADHLEDQLFPASTWGKVYAVARSQGRTTNPPDLIRVMAQVDGTQVTVTPAPTSGSCGTLNAGQFCEFWISGDTDITGSAPILVAHFLASEGGSDPQGDPSLSYSVPTEQFRNDYSFLAPSQYKSNWASLVAPAAGNVMLDGTDVTSMLATFGDSAFKAGRISIQPGPHTLSCDMGCGVEVYGYDSAVSYLFAGGLDLKQIVISKPSR